MTKKEDALVKSFEEIDRMIKALEEFGFQIFIPIESEDRVITVNSPLFDLSIKNPKKCIKRVDLDGGSVPHYYFVNSSGKEIKVPEKVGYLHYEYICLVQKPQNACRARILSLLGKKDARVTSKIRKSYPSDPILVSMCEVLKALTLKKMKEGKARLFERVVDTRALEVKEIERIQEYLREKYPESRYFKDSYITRKVLEKIE